MYLNQFSVRVPEGRETTSGYVEIEHSKQYTLVLRNDRSVRCDAEVSIDGKHIGVFRIAAHSNIRLERKPDDEGRFTFYRLESLEAKRTDLASISVSDLGLIKVVFTPENRPMTITYSNAPWCWYPWCAVPTTADPRPDYDLDTITHTTSAITAATIPTDSIDASALSVNCFSCAPGGTGLSGKSGQQFKGVGDMSLDYCQQTTIHLRLIEGSAMGEPRPLKPTQASNPIPSPVISGAALSFSNGASIRVGEEGQLIIDGGGHEIRIENHGGVLG